MGYMNARYENRKARRLFVTEPYKLMKKPKLLNRCIRVDALKMMLARAQEACVSSFDE